MRLKLLSMAMIDRIAVALNFKTMSESVAEDDAWRTKILGDHTEIARQTSETEKLADELASRL